MNQGKRVGIVGAGNVGATVAYSLAMLGTCHEIILRDNKIDVAKGKALDMSQAAAAVRSHTVVTVAEDMSDLTNCDVVVITAGSPRLPGMSRDDLLSANAEIVGKATRETIRRSPNAIYIILTNPLDAMAYLAMKLICSGVTKSAASSRSPSFSRLSSSTRMTILPALMSAMISSVRLMLTFDWWSNRR